MKKPGEALSRRGLFTKLTASSAAVLSAPSVVLPGSRQEKLVRIGIVGGGFGSLFYWHEHPDSEVVAVAELRDDRREKLRRQNPGATAYKDFKDLVQDKRIDAVGVFTGAPAHAWMSIEAMRRGKHVICAVPAAMSMEECESLIDTVKATGMTYMNAETRCYHPGIMTCRRWNDEGKFGEIFYSEGDYNHDVPDFRGKPWWFEYGGKRTWRYGYPPMLYTTHCLAGIMMVTGERLTEVACSGWGHDHPSLKENRYGNNPFSNSVALFKTSGGHSSRITMFRHCAVAVPLRNAFFGTQMSYLDALDSLNRGLVTTTSHEAEVRQWEPEPYQHLLPPELRKPSGHSGSHTHLTHEFVRSVLEQRWPAINVYEAIAYCAPGITAHESALHGGEWTKIRDFGKAPRAA